MITGLLHNRITRPNKQEYLSLKEQSDPAVHCLSFHLHPCIVDALLDCKTKLLLAWAWLAKAKGHSCHTKNSTLAKTFTEKNE